MTPAEELKRINRLIRQFESVFKSTKDPVQRDRVTGELRKLKTYKQKLESFHEFDPVELEESEPTDALAAFPYLKLVIDAGARKGSAVADVLEEDYLDKEVYHLALYLAYFESEFLALLSEMRLKLDFKYSLERDSFYHRFENLRRLLLDIREDTSRLEEYLGQKHEEEMRLRSFKKNRNVIMESDKLFRDLIHFAGSLTEDIAAAGSVCLNAIDVLRFDKIHGHRALDGLPVAKALAELHSFAREVVEFLNVPQIDSQES